MKPTDEQVKEFWEWCGFRYTDYHEGRGNWNEVRFPDGHIEQALKFALRPYPTIDLNNLFKYAVPKLGTLLPIYQVMYILKDWIETVIVSQKDPALALFWAIYDALKGS